LHADKHPGHWPEERAKQAELLQAVQSNTNTDALAKQAALHAVAMLKVEVVKQFTADHLGSTASSMSSATAVQTPWNHPASSPRLCPRMSRLPTLCRG
jgi:hypothetical protein